MLVANDNNQEGLVERAFNNLFQRHNAFDNPAEGAFQGLILSSLLIYFITALKDLTIEDSAFIIKFVALSTIAGALAGLIIENQPNFFRRQHP